MIRSDGALESAVRPVVALLIASGQATELGNNTIVTPTSGFALRLFYLSCNPHAVMECAFRFGAAGPLFLRNNLPANSVIAKDFGPSRFIETAVDEPLVLNLSIAGTCNWTVFYTEV